MRASFQDLTSLLGDVLSHMSEVHTARMRNESLNLGIAQTAHEFRRPLVGARAAIERLMDDPDASMEDHDYLLRESFHELDRLVQLVDPLLRWAVGVSPIRRRPVELRRIVEAAVLDCRQESVPGRVSVEYSSLEPMVVLADERHLRGGIANIVRNGLLYSPPDRDVTVYVERGEARASVIVRDQGPGVHASERESIFDPFVRGRASAGSRDGAGLGLFIARRILEAHEGSIWVDTSMERGVFHIEIPLATGKLHFQAQYEGERREGRMEALRAG